MCLCSCHQLEGRSRRRVPTNKAQHRGSPPSSFLGRAHRCDYSFIRSPVKNTQKFSRYSCYTDPVKNVTISLDEELAHWARRKAADENTSVSKLVARLLDREMRASDKYWQAYEQWKKLDIKLDASKRGTREEAHERR